MVRWAMFKNRGKSIFEHRAWDKKIKWSTDIYIKRKGVSQIAARKSKIIFLKQIMAFLKLFQHIQNYLHLNLNNKNPLVE